MVLFRGIEIPQNCQFGETTLQGYYVPLRTLNVERLLFTHLRCVTVVGRSAVLNGILQGTTLTPLHDAP